MFPALACSSLHCSELLTPAGGTPSLFLYPPSHLCDLSLCINVCSVTNALRRLVFDIGGCFFVLCEDSYFHLTGACDVGRCVSCMVDSHCVPDAVFVFYQRILFYDNHSILTVCPWHEVLGSLSLRTIRICFFLESCRFIKQQLARFAHQRFEYAFVLTVLAMLL